MVAREAESTMRIKLEPKALFCNTTADVDKANFTTIMATSTARYAATMALAQMAQLGASQEALAGANAFAHIFMNLADPEDKLPEFPTKQLKTG